MVLTFYAKSFAMIGSNCHAVEYHPLCLAIREKKISSRESIFVYC